MPNEEGQVTVEGMDAALDELVKAANATDLVKGDASGVEHSGHMDERGKVGGGRGSMSDSGGLDKMMIAKLTEAGFDAELIGKFDEFVAKQTKGEEEEEEDEMSAEMREMVGKMQAYEAEHGSLEGFGKSEGASDGDGSGDGTEPLNKSMADFRSDPDIAEAIDVSPYLEAMTTRTADQIDNMRKSIEAGQSDQANVNQAMAGAVYQVGTLLKSQAAVIDELSKRLGIVERTPNPPKGVTSGAQALNKSMPGEAGAGGGEPLSKSELLSTLSYMNLEKGINTIGQTPTSEAIYLLEGGNVLGEEIVKAANDFLSNNPNEAQVARQYR